LSLIETLKPTIDKIIESTKAFTENKDNIDKLSSALNIIITVIKFV